MTFEFNDFDTQVQSDELVDERISDEDLESADEFYNELDFELNELLDEMQDGVDYHDLDEETRLADEEWNEHYQDVDVELLDDELEFQDED